MKASLFESLELVVKSPAIDIKELCSFVAVEV
jgi:hypothetical protein